MTSHCNLQPEQPLQAAGASQPGLPRSLPIPLAAVAALPTTGQLGSFNPGQMFLHSQRSLLNPYATGLAVSAPLGGCVQQPAVALARYTTGLASGMGRVQRSWACSTLAARSRVQREFTGFLASQPANFGLNWSTAGPSDIIAFSETVWVPLHAGTELPHGKGKVVAPSSLSGE
jgi:hypothetical protein